MPKAHNLAKLTTPLALAFLGKDEMNLAQLPLTLVTDRVPRELVSEASLRRSVRSYCPTRRRTIEGELIIEGSKEYGLPTASDARIQLALIQMSKQQDDFRSPRVRFSLRQLLEHLNWRDDGHSYARLKHGLFRLQGVRYICEDCWYDHGRKRIISSAFSLIDRVDIDTGRGREGGDDPGCQVVWGDAFFESLKRGYLRTVDYELCRSLESDIALRIYRFLGKQAGRGTHSFSFDLREFAHDVVGLAGRYQGGSHIARALRRGLNELESVGFLVPAPDSQRYSKHGRRWTIHLEVVPNADVTCQLVDPEAPSHPRDSQEHQLTFRLDANPDRDPAALIPVLIDYGITPRRAKRLATAFSRERIRRQVDHLEWLLAHQPGKVLDPPAFLIRAIESDYPLPRDFRPVDR